MIKHTGIATELNQRNATRIAQLDRQTRSPTCI